MTSSCDFIAGWVGGCVGVTVGHPLDTLKVNDICDLLNLKKTSEQNKSYAVTRKI